MALVKFLASHKCSKNLPIKNIACFATSPQPAQEERGKKTSLFDFHVNKGGKIVNFAGYLLPVQYSDQGIAASHVHTRTPGCASIFDVSMKIPGIEAESHDNLPIYRSLTCSRRK